MPKIKVDVSGVDATFREFRYDLTQGMENAVESLAEQAREVARQRIDERPHVFTGDMVESFRYTKTRSSSKGVEGTLYNTAEHAGAINDGVPASEYADGGPPIQNLLPWVEEKLGGMTLDYDPYEGGGSSGNRLFIDGYGEYTVPAGHRGHEDGDISFSDTYSGQTITVYSENDGDVFESTIEKREGTASGFNIHISDKSGSTVQLVGGSNDNFKIVSSEPFDQLDEIGQNSALKYELEDRYWETGIVGEKSTIIENLLDSIIRDSQDKSVPKKVIDQISSFTEYTKNKYAASATRFENADGLYRTRLNYKPSNNRATHIHEFIHAFHNAFNYLSGQPSEGDPEWNFAKDGSSNKSSFYHLANYTLKKKRSDDPTVDSNDVDASHAGPGYEQGLERATNKYLNDQSFDDFFSLDTSVTDESTIFHPETGEIDMSEGTAFKVTVASADEWWLTLDEGGLRETEHYDTGETVYEVPVKKLDTGGTPMLTIDETGEFTGDVTLDGIVDITNPTTDQEVAVAFRENQFAPQNIPWESVNTSDIYSSETGLKNVNIGDVLHWYSEFDGDEKYVRITSISRSASGHVLNAEPLWGNSEEFITFNEERGELIGGTPIEIFRPESLHSESVVLEEENSIDRLMEAANMAWIDMAYQVSASDKIADNWESRINWVGRQYSSKGAHETLTSLTEVLTGSYNDSEHYVNKSEVQSIYNAYPYLVEAWAEVWPLSDMAKEALEEEGVEINDDGTLRTGN